MAGKIKFQGVKSPNCAMIAVRERALLQKHYNFMTHEIKGHILYSYGFCQPTEDSPIYKYRIKYDPLFSPTVTILSPKVEYNDDIHMYPSDNSLCLYHKSDLVWNSTHHLYDKIIPWTQEWFVFYELYKMCGVWLHPEVKHITNKNKS